MSSTPFRIEPSLLFSSSSSSSLLPLWEGGEELKRDLDKLVAHPLSNPEEFDAVLNPFQWMLSVYGREGMQKAPGIEKYCQSLGIRTHLVHAEFGKSHVAHEELVNFFLTLQSRPPPLSPSFNTALIINRFHLLVLYPETNDLMEFLLNLSSTAQRHGIVVFALLDLNIRSALGQLSESTRAFREAVMKQFRVRFYYPRPHSAFRSAFFRAFFEAALQRYGRKLVVQLTDEDYANIETATVFASPTEMLLFLQQVMSDALSENNVNPFSREPGVFEGPVTINYNVINDYLSVATGNRHILKWDPRLAENEFSEMCGKGGIPGASNSKSEKPAITKFEKKNIIRKDAKRNLKGDDDDEEKEDTKRVKLKEEEEEDDILLTKRVKLEDVLKEEEEEEENPTKGKRLALKREIE